MFHWFDCPCADEILHVDEMTSAHAEAVVVVDYFYLFLSMITNESMYVF